MDPRFDPKSLVGRKRQDAICTLQIKSRAQRNKFACLFGTVLSPGSLQRWALQIPPSVSTGEGGRLERAKFSRSSAKVKIKVSNMKLDPRAEWKACFGSVCVTCP